MDQKEINKILEEFEASRKVMQAKLQEVFKEEVRDFFENNPDIKTILWTQYTPYWNDGEECTFRRYEFVLTTFDDLDLVDDDDDWDEIFNELVWGDYESEDPTRKIYTNHTWNDQKYLPSHQELVNKLNRIPDDIYMSMFGDHVSVVVKRDGISTEEYDHD